MNHDRLKLCKDRKLPDWIHKHLGKIPLDANADSNKFLSVAVMTLVRL